VILGLALVAVDMAYSSEIASDGLMVEDNRADQRRPGRPNHGRAYLCAAILWKVELATS